MPTSISQLRMNMLNNKGVQSQSKANSDKDLLIEEKEEKIFAKRGENNYNSAMDYNDDGVITYDEYMRYCSENAVSQYSTSPNYTFTSSNTKSINNLIRPIHIGKALDTYSHFGEI